jgi:hypothetical protein
VVHLADLARRVDLGLLAAQGSISVSAISNASVSTPCWSGIPEQARFKLNVASIHRKGAIGAGVGLKSVYSLLSGHFDLPSSSSSCAAKAFASQAVLSRPKKQQPAGYLE